MIRILCLGGCGEIGLNSIVVEINEKLILIDSGMGFPSCSHYGVDLLIPDFKYIRENQEKLEAILLTHGHEDHIGALPYLFSQLERSVPVFGGEFTLALAEKRFEGFETESKPKWSVVSPFEKMEINENIFAKFIPVTHSTVDSYAIALYTDEGIIFHTGDFKIDRSPLNGDPFPENEIRNVGSEGVKILLSESTNVELPGYSLPEKDVKESLFKIFEKAEGRILFTTFSSHITRIKEVIDISAQLGRKVYISGRSIKESVEIAFKLGIFGEEERKAIIGDLSDIPDRAFTIIVTGSQGEPFSTLYRISRNEDRNIKIKPDDIVIISAKFIPGQEKAIYSYINRLYKLGVKEVFYEKLHQVHASGHAHREELREMIRMIRPEIFIPVHGEYRHLELHRRLASEEGIEKTFVLQNGEGVVIEGEEIHKFEYPVGVTYIDGLSTGDLSGEVMKKRKFISREGLIVLFGVINSAREFSFGPKIFSLGIVEEDVFEELKERITGITTEVLKNIKKVSPDHIPLIEEEMRVRIRRFMRGVTGKNPLITVILEFEN